MSNSDNRFSRRQLLSAAGVAAATSLAGCNQLGLGGNKDGEPNQSPTTTDSLSDFNYPDGFSKDSVNLAVALGKDSPMVSLKSVSANVERSISTTQGSRTTVQKGDFSKVNDKFFVDINTNANDQSATQQYYYENGTIYIKQNYPNKEVEYKKNTFKFNARSLYNIAQLEQHLKGTSLSISSIEQRNGRKVAVYTADSKDLASDSLFKNVSSGGQYGSLQEASVTVVVDERGYIHLANFNATYKTQDGQTNTIKTKFVWKNFNSANVTEPQWVQTATFTDLTTTPKADVSFEETKGEKVTITVKNIQEADYVDVLVGQSPAVRFTEPGEKVVQASTYTSQDGTVKTISVYAYKQEQQPVQVAEYTPKAPASSTGTTTPTTTTNSST